MDGFDFKTKDQVHGDEVATEKSQEGDDFTLSSYAPSEDQKRSSVLDSDDEDIWTSLWNFRIFLTPRGTYG